jgi:hypothetical protein
VLEAFPKVFLATMFDPTHIDSNLNRFGTERFAADWAMASWLFQGLPEGFRGTIENPMKRLSDIRLHVPTDALGIEYIFSNKDVTAAYISALSGALAFSGCASVLGSDRHGSFLLPASWLWHDAWKERFRRIRTAWDLSFKDSV